jgi:hypothetical protein
MKRIFLLTLCVGAILFAAQPVRFSATTGDVSLSGTGTSFTIQQRATNGRPIQLESAAVYCSVACNVTQSQNGAAATATAGTAYPILPTLNYSATATVWTASNVGSGTAAGGVVHVPAGVTVPLDLSKISMGNTGTGTNYTVTVSAITGTANITLIWTEQQ